MAFASSCCRDRRGEMGLGVTPGDRAQPTPCPERVERVIAQDWEGTILTAAERLDAAREAPRAVEPIADCGTYGTAEIRALVPENSRIALSDGFPAM
jgi:hypothetical protein